MSEGWKTVDDGNDLFALFPFLTSSESEVREKKGVNSVGGSVFLASLSLPVPITKAPAEEKEMGQHVNNFPTSAAAGELNHSE